MNGAIDIVWRLCYCLSSKDSIVINVIGYNTEYVVVFIFVEVDILNSIAVVYKSKYGSTKQYAEWIAEELNAILFEAASMKPSQLLDFDIVIYGGGLYASGINGVKLVTKNPCKSLVVFTVGAADPNTTDYSEILSKNFSQEFLSKIKVFHLHGGIDYTRLSSVHKVMMAMVKRTRVDSKPQEHRSDEDRIFLETYGKKFDYKNKATIKPLVDYVHSL